MPIKILALPLIALLIITSCKKSENEDEKIKKVDITEEKLEAKELNLKNIIKPIIFEYTSTGCPGCGSWGKPTFKGLVEQNKNDVEALAVHINYGDIMITKYSNEIGANRHGQSYTPQIWVNDSNGVVLNGNSINGMSSVERINKLIQLYKQNPSDILTDITFDKGEKKVAVRYGLKSVSNTKNLYISCYLIENDVIAGQSSYANNPAKHGFVIREAINGTFGQNPNLDTNNQFTAEYKSEFELKEPNGIYKLTVVIWEKLGGRFRPLGAYSVAL